MPPSKFRRERERAAMHDPVTRPARTYLMGVSATDLGLSQDFQCVIWFVDSLPY